MNHPILLGLLGSAAASLGTGLGAVLVFAFRRLSEPVENALLSIAAGIMLAASFFSLIVPGIEHARSTGSGELVATSIVVLGILGGALVLSLVHRFTPHEHFTLGREGPDAARLSRLWLFVIAITLHNLPEGMAVGVGFGTGDVEAGIPLAIGIGVQNVPEGLAVATSLVAIGYTRMRAFCVAFLSGLVEPLGGALGATAATLADALLPLTLGFAAGAMLFVISGEIIPETHRRGTQGLATFSLLFGFVVMMLLDAGVG
jgi:ZIP family zinc transporter